MGETPQPGRPVRGSRTGRPIMALFDLLGRRWALRILWELRDGNLTYTQLQARCEGISSSVLRDRLKELVAARIVFEQPEGGYATTPKGAELGRHLLALDGWAKGWAMRGLSSASSRSVRSSKRGRSTPG